MHRHCFLSKIRSYIPQRGVGMHSPTSCTLSISCELYVSEVVWIYDGNSIWYANTYTGYGICVFSGTFPDRWWLLVPLCYHGNSNIGNAIREYTPTLCISYNLRTAPPYINVPYLVYTCLPTVYPSSTKWGSYCFHFFFISYYDKYQQRMLTNGTDVLQRVPAIVDIHHDTICIPFFVPVPYMYICIPGLQPHFCYIQFVTHVIVFHTWLWKKYKWKPYVDATHHSVFHMPWLYHVCVLTHIATCINVSHIV